MKATDRFFVAGVSCSLQGEGRPVANLSVGGFFVATEQAPPPGQIMDIEMKLGARAPFRFTGKVSWVNDVESPKSPDLPNGCGIKIVKIDFPHKLAIVDFLKRIVHEEEGAKDNRAR